ncbi:LysR family transcriptional regulator [Nocardioides limicola]|uniref:LysR family transcriptional regulator n=1 Tax=Nocardioides limicola TaxID=2803368 RepID=UPI00193B994A|nr:LysR substrate-binding domain-containing protein [Nocardioides sp. DJM-14]
MELRHLRYFAAVAETCHFGKAAERLLIAQPALSQAIRNLESELGASLFSRTTRHVSLTPAGEFLHERTRQLLAYVDDSVRGIEEIASGRTGVVRVGMVGTAAFSHLPRIASLVKQALPQVTLEIQADMLTPDQCDSLRSGAIDLAVLRPPAIGDGISLRVLEVEPLILAAPTAHPLADAADVALEDLRATPFIGYGARDSAVNQAVMRAFRTVDFAPFRTHEAPGTAVLLALVAAGLGVALVPASARAVPLAGVVFRDVREGGSVELALGWRQDDPNPVVASVLSILVADKELAELASSFVPEGTP